MPDGARGETFRDLLLWGDDVVEAHGRDAACIEAWRAWADGERRARQEAGS